MTISVEHLAYSMPGALANLASNGEWQYAPHLGYLEDKLLEVVDGKLTRLLISMPPQNGKSSLISQYFSAWFLGRFPTRKVILASYESTFASSWGRKARDVLEATGEDVFDVKVAQRSRAVNYWETEQGGYMATAGAGGSITGRGADIFIIDDPIKNSVEALSTTRQDQIWEWFRTTVYTRLSPDAALIVIMTRWTVNDLIGRLLDEQERGGDVWTYVNLPAIAEEEDPLGRKEGEALWPNRYNLEWLEARKRVLGEFWFNAMYQGKPVPQAGFIVNVKWFRRYHTPPMRSAADMIVLSMDTAMNDREINDYTAIMVWFLVENAYYLIDVLRDRFDYPRLQEVTTNMIARWAPHAVLIENRGSGMSLIQSLEGQAPVVSMDPTGGGNKNIRLQVETPAIEAGQVYLPEDGSVPWLFDFVEEIRAFPNTRWRDQGDCLSQFLRWARERRVGVEMW